MTRSAQQHTASAMRQLQTTGAYAGQGFTASLKLDARGGRRFTVRTNGQALRGLDALWSCLDAEWRGLEAAAALEAARAEILATYRRQGGAALQLQLPLQPFTVTAVDRLTDSGLARADASAMVDQVTDELINTRWAAAVAELPTRAAPLTRAAAVAGGADPFNNPMRHARATAFVRVSDDWAADAWAAAELEQLRQGA